MDDQIIKCPSCGSNIPLTEALSNKIKEGLEAEFQAKSRAKELEIKRREESLVSKVKEIEEQKKSVEEIVFKRLSLERARLLEEAKKKVSEEKDLELRDLREENLLKEKKLEEARSQELELRKKARELEEAKKNLDLEMARKLDSERDRIRQATIELFSEEHRLKDLEKDKRIADMLNKIDELKRKGEQGSMQTQGEVLELDLELLLKEKFPLDVIEPVAKGIRGADIVQKVYTRAGHYCGSIAWESKRTKAWNDEWITKLKDDQREVKAEAAVIVTEALPKGVAAFAHIEGVWVTGVPLAGALAEAIRLGLTQVAQSRLSAVGKNEKMEAIYEYLSGAGFRQRVEAIIESFRSMKEDLDSEKRSVMKAWAKREKQIERVMANTSGMYGDMQGIIGSTLPEIKLLELGSGEEEPE